MNNKIKELTEKRNAAMMEAYTALFVKDNSTIKYRAKPKTIECKPYSTKQKPKENSKHTQQKKQKQTSKT